MRIISLLPWLLALAIGQSSLSYTVQHGDTLYSIAKRYNTSVEVLLKLNNLSDPTLSSGQVLQLPPQVVQHTVQRGDTLYSIARKYSSSVDAIRKENSLEGTALSPGQVLRIPQTAAPVSTVVSNPTPAPTPSAPTQPAPKPDNTSNPPTGSQAALTNSTPLPTPTPPAPTQPTPTQPTPTPTPETPQPTPQNQAIDTDYDPSGPLVPVILKYLGLPYIYGANSDRAVDCSAFVQQVYAEMGIKLPRTSREQWAAFTTVQGAMRQGDLVFFSFGGKQIDHVGIYLGRGVFAHANSYGSRVVIESLNSPYYKKVFKGAKRVEPAQANNP